jgi:hypothetical protein
MATAGVKKYLDDCGIKALGEATLNGFSVFK